ncbi:hypothetical protein B0G75_14025 [Paraburkholderia sp. BL18I3N2]|uniref:oxidoreductase n=1 Tax=unclassified Paraburkholderia TaxID=2615204 RepID=UPI000D05AA05|nr:MULTISPECIES: NADH:flavin oxidoreductase [unclassified Paraburkholderia]PRX18851.1 hypothetical protein B0G75_14025 [Paraburkholderia sp. BL18I3N2]PRX87896.1 hypothetical protein B0G73_15123 [Paraburkholderia sp. BL25I1N1]REE07507.1 hypothetical protein B0G71_8024 [Paraburkholderia sp. BL27I4N3]
MNQYPALFQPLKIKGVTIRNRVFSTGHAPMYAANGVPTERYLRYHQEKAKGGIGLTIFGGATSVAPDAWAAYWSTLVAKDDSCVEPLRDFANGIREHGAAVMIQLTHLGRKMKWDQAPWLPPISSSSTREPDHRSFPKEAEDWDIKRAINDYAQAVRRCRDAGLDGCELLFSAHHLVDQFWSRAVNRRTDGYGGTLENRMRFGLEVLEKARELVGDDFVIGCRMSADELLPDGNDQSEQLAIASRYAGTGMLDFINVVTSNVQDFNSHSHYVPNMSYPPAPYLGLASAIKREVDIKVFHASRITDLATANRAIEEGHVDMVGMTRAHIADPHIMKKLVEGRPEQIRDCVNASYCIDRVYGGDAACLHNAATGRERTLPHIIVRSSERKRVVVVGAGPGGLEAARAAGERGHTVTLFEAADRTGGQINIAARGPWREPLSGIVRWLDSEVRRLGVDVRLNTRADAEAVLALDPQVVIVATGGIPNKGRFKGHELAVSSWDILTGRVEPAHNVLLWDDNGQHQGLSVGEFMAKRGSLIELVTPDRMPAAEVGITNFPVHLREIYKHAGIFTPDRRLIEVYAEATQLVAVLRNEYSGQEEERVIDQVVAEHGTLPVDELYFALREGSVNFGEVDLNVLAEEDRVIDVIHNPSGRFRLYRVGDAVASRNIHAAIYDSLRIGHDL